MNVLNEENPHKLNEIRSRVESIIIKSKELIRKNDILNEQVEEIEEGIDWRLYTLISDSLNKLKKLERSKEYLLDLRRLLCIK